jgi:hypothetical protein
MGVRHRDPEGDQPGAAEPLSQQLVTCAGTRALHTPSLNTDFSAGPTAANRQRMNVQCLSCRQQRSDLALDEPEVLRIHPATR